MSVVIYNGIKMELVKTNGVERIPIFSSDKTTYLYTQWTHDFVAILNPAATAYDATGVAAAGSLPIVTDKVLRHKLAQGHAVYEWYVGDSNVVADRVIRSPAVGAKTDVNNGPHPEVVSIVQVTGTHTWMIHMRITTWINDCPQAPLILSHRWRQEADYNSDHFATRTTTGEAIFNPVRLAEIGRKPDDFRIRLGHPVPVHFQRMGITVAQGEDGVTVNYSFVDTERPMNINVQAGITNITCERSVAYSGASFFESLASTASAGIGGALVSVNPDDFNNAMSRSRGRAFIGSRNVMRSASLGFVQAASTSIAGSLPTITLGVRISVTGSRLSNKKQMLVSGLSLLANRTADFIATFDPRVKIAATFDDAGKAVSIDANYVIGGTGIAGVLIVNGFFNVWSSSINPGNLQNVAPSTVAELAISQLLTPPGESIATGLVSISNSGLVQNPVFPNSGGTRGTWVERIVAQNLSESCQEPMDPPAPTVSMDVS